MIVALSGIYPEGTYERFRELLPEDVELLKIDTPEKYQALDRADVVILRIFRAEKEDILRIKGLRMISRWGVGYDSVDVETASASRNLVRRVHNAGKQIYAWTVNTRDGISDMIDRNVDNIITDDVSLALQCVYESRYSDLLTEFVEMLEAEEE